MTNNLKAERTLTAESKMSDADWLDESARYFERRPTGGEDMAFWANVANAERCRSIAKSLRSQSLSTQQLMGEVRVKPLEWVNGVAKTPFWTYFTSRHVDGHYRLAITGVPSSEWTAHRHLDALEAAAQADFNGRILSALHPNQESGE